VRPARSPLPPARSKRTTKAGLLSGSYWSAWLRWFGKGHRTSRIILFALAGIVALILLSMIIDAGMYHNQIHAGVTIAGQSVSGLTRDEATARLEQLVAEASGDTVRLTYQDKSWDVRPNLVGIKIDVTEAVEAALGLTRDSNHVADLVHKLQLYFRGRDIPLGGTVNAAGLDAVIEQIAATLDRPAVNAALEIRGDRVTAVEGQDGLVVDKAVLRQQLTEALLSLEPPDPAAEIVVPVTVDTPDVQVEDNAEAFATTRTMISASLTLTSGDFSWTFNPREVASYIDFKSENSNGVPTLVPFLSSEMMAAKLAELAAQAATPAADAYFVAKGDKAEVVPAVDGTTLDPVKTAETLTTAAKRTGNRTAEAVMMKQEADLTTAEAEAMGITDLLGTYKTSYVGTDNRQHNVKLTFEYLLKEGKLYLAPGQEFSFKETVGPRTEERGYKKAPGVVTGVALEDVYGGGICQVSTTMFNAIILAGLKVTERRNHTLYIEHYPRGRDATVTDQGADLRFINDTDHHIWVTGKSDGIHNTISIYGTNDGRKSSLEVGPWYGIWGPLVQTSLDPYLPTNVSYVADPGQRAKMCMLYMTVTWPNGTSKKSEFVSNYKHRPTIVAVGTATTTTTVAPPTTPPATGGP
jgi:vancomycin resistance protein YoaR